MKAKQFFYVCAGVLMLVIAYHLGAPRADAQSSGDFTGISMTSNNVTLAIRSNGDIYARDSQVACYGTGTFGWFSNGNICGVDEWTYVGNVLGGPIQTEGASWGKLKDSYRK